MRGLELNMMVLHDTTRLLTRRQVSIITGLSRTTLWRYVHEGWFPEPRRTPGGELRWLDSDVMGWIYGLPSGKGEAPERAQGKARIGHHRRPQMEQPLSEAAAPHLALE